VVSPSITSNPRGCHPSDGKWAYAGNEFRASRAPSAPSPLTPNRQAHALKQLPCCWRRSLLSLFDKPANFFSSPTTLPANVVVFPILPDGNSANTPPTVKMLASRPNKERQKGPHAHWVEVTANNRFASVTRSGHDRVLTYPFNLSNGTINYPHSAALQFFRNVNRAPGPKTRHGGVATSTLTRSIVRHAE